jgi:hypothetical protein
MKKAAIGVMILGTFSPVIAAAEPAPASATAAAPSSISGVQTRGYGEQILIADALALAVVWFVPRPAFLRAAAAWYAVAPPMIHLLHGRPGRAAGSLGLRVALPVAGGLLGDRLSNCEADDLLCAGTGLTLGGVLGLATATALDAFLLARGTWIPEPATPEPAPLAQVAGLQIDHATFSPTPDGGALLLTGRF